MANGIDCATPLSDSLARYFASDGNTFVCRYLVPTGWKRLTKEEADYISNAGMNIVSVFEIFGNLASMSAIQGKLDGESALKCAANVGQPEGSTIYFAIDFEPSNEDLPAIGQYIKAASDATPNYSTGVYGCKKVIDYIQSINACSHFWQTYAWSHGLKSNGINIFQSKNDITLHGIGVDLNQSFGNEGWWNKKTIVKEAEKVDTVNQNLVKIADILIGVCGTLYNVGIFPEESHQLANVLREATGRPKS